MFYAINIEAKPRNRQNPTMSVRKVSKTLEAIAGSTSILFKVIGIIEPRSPAIVKLIATAKAKMKDKLRSW